MRLPLLRHLPFRFVMTDNSNCAAKKKLGCGHMGMPHKATGG